MLVIIINKDNICCLKCAKKIINKCSICIKKMSEKCAYYIQLGKFYFKISKIFP